MKMIDTVEALEARLAEPSEKLIEDIAGLEGDILILGVGGKMGPSLAKLARHAIAKAGVEKRVIGVSRFSSGGLQAELHEAGVETIAADLLDDAALQSLPQIPNVIFMAGQKFGTSGQEALTWAMNTYLPGRVAEKFRDSRIVAFSTGNVYPLMPVGGAGATEETAIGPVGEYAQSCLGRERMFEHFSKVHGTPVVLFRLNYAVDLRYGVLLDVAEKVYQGEAVDVRMGHANVIWQGDANEMALRSLDLASSPPRKLNITGPETVSVRWLAEEFGRLFGKDPIIEGEEQSTALLNNASLSHHLLGYPTVPLRQMIEWMAHWVELGGQTLGKPTHFQEREGKF